MAKETLKLTKDNFFNAVAKEAPVAMKAFSEEVDRFKAKVSWDSLFSITGVTPEGKPSGVKFHEIPYGLQIGFLNLFFAGHDVLFYVNPSDTKIKGYSWMVIDTVAGHMAKSFVDTEQTTQTVFQSYIQCEIDALRSAFLILNERLDVTTDNQEDKTSLN